MPKQEVPRLQDALGDLPCDEIAVLRSDRQVGVVEEAVYIDVGADGLDLQQGRYDGMRASRVAERDVVEYPDARVPGDGAEIDGRLEAAHRRPLQDVGQHQVVVQVDVV